MTSTGTRVSSPRRMNEPLPNCRSIWREAASRAFSLSPARSALGLVFPAIGTPCRDKGLAGTSRIAQVVFVVVPPVIPADRWTRYAPPLTFLPASAGRSSAGISRAVTGGTSGRDHCRRFNYRANVYSTMRDTPKKAGNPRKSRIYVRSGDLRNAGLIGRGGRANIIFVRTNIDNVGLRTMDAAGRINQLVEALRLHGRVDVATAAAEFGTAEITVRRDLDVLVERGVARRVRGGAVNLMMRGEELPFAIGSSTPSTRRSASPAMSRG